MAPITHTFHRRDFSNKTTIGLLTTFLVLIIVSIACVGALWFLRRTRRARQAAGLIPFEDDNDKLSTPKKRGHRRASGISIASTMSFSSEKRKSGSKFVDEEKQEFLRNTTPPPSGGLPQIRITFPEETDEDGKKQSGRVVVLHVDDKGGVGMEPLPEGEQLPPYEQDRFVSLDLERIGGLKEKEYVPATKGGVAV